MASGEVKISALPAGVALTGAELVPAVQGGTTKYFLASAFISGGADVKQTETCPYGSTTNIILNADTFSGYSVDFTAVRGSRLLKGRLSILKGNTGVGNDFMISVPDTETENCGITFAWDTSGGNHRLNVTVDSSDTTDVEFYYYVRTF